MAAWYVLTALGRRDEVLEAPTRAIAQQIAARRFGPTVRVKSVASYDITEEEYRTVARDRRPAA